MSRPRPAARLLPGLLVGAVLAAGLLDRPGAPGSAAASRRPAGWTLDPAEFKAGIVLGLYSQEPDHDYRPKLREIRRLGARWVELLVVQYQQDGTSSCIGPDPVKTPTDEALARAIRAAHAEGLRVLLLPVVLLAEPREKEWRGNIRPASRKEWFASYRRLLLGYAELAEREGVEALSVGSELCSMEHHERFWRRLVERVRAVYGGLLTYSANWDHHQVAQYYDALDFVGLSAYFSLARTKQPSLAELLDAWRPVHEKLAAWQARHGKPVAFLEIGYPSVDGGATDPWNYVMEGPEDLAEQALAYEALRRTFVPSPLLSGLFVYDWWDGGGPRDRLYTARGKPAERVLRELLRELAPPPAPLTRP